MLALLQFLRTLTDYRAWSPPSLRASFLIDDPNLHWPSYGYVKFARLARHADEHGYHLGFATIPLEAWFVQESTAQLFREHESRVSLTVHGNDHVYRELEAVTSREQTTLLLRQAQWRIRRLERRSGLSVGRVMVPPHGVCADDVFLPLVECGFDALCRTLPWWGLRSGISGLLGGSKLQT